MNFTHLDKFKKEKKKKMILCIFSFLAIVRTITKNVSIFVKKKKEKLSEVKYFLFPCEGYMSWHIEKLVHHYVYTPSIQSTV